MQASPTSLELTPEFKKALDVLLEGENHVFITGRAGTGKSTLLSHFISQRKSGHVVLAPTGVAALNVGGQTIHSFFGFWPNMTLDEVKRQARFKKKKGRIYTALEAIVIDEISMVRADMLDAIDIFLRLVRSSDQPFGGVRLICFGDVQQLSPVARNDEVSHLLLLYPSLYFFDSFVFRDMLSIESSRLELLELTKLYRQVDQEFISYLNGIRDKSITDDHLSLFNERVVSEVDLGSVPAQTIVLTSTNAQAQRINDQKLRELAGKASSFKSSISGKFERGSYPTEGSLFLKEGARVMMVNNDQESRWVNGSMGTISEFIQDPENAQRQGVLVQLDDGDLVEVWNHTWELSKSVFNQTTQKIERETVGTFTQLPMKLAWAVTIHKSQGKTFDQVLVDLGHGAFAPGQTYVALSRCRTLEGLSMIKPLRHKDILLDETVVKFMEKLKSGQE